MPACAITSTVLVSSWSFCLVELNAGRSSVGPNTMAKLCSDILFSLSCSWTLDNGREEKSVFGYSKTKMVTMEKVSS